jgi:hypothetical protein
MAAIGAFVGLAGYAVTNAVTTAITGATDPTWQTLTRNRYIAAGTLTVGGLAVAALASPMIGVGLAAAGAVALVGTRASALLTSILPAPDPAPKKMAGLGGPRELRQLGIGSVASTMGAIENTMGALQVGAMPPWVTSQNPF